MKLNKIAIAVLGLLIPVLALAQSNSQNKPVYYKFPVKPGERNFLSGTMGELRPGHFHGGIDIKTDGVTGLPIYAAAPGYISRIKISTGGYGNALYLAHPNGHTTVYGHLEKFEPKLWKWVKEQQYKNQSFEIELFPDKDQFGYEAGEIIAYGGNTGGSGGPHLHFEVRDASQDVLNPLDWRFEEIKDTQAPLIYKVALQAMDIQSRVKNEFGRFEFKPVYTNSNYNLTGSPIKVWGNIGIELLGYDKLDGASNNNGFPKIEVSSNGKLVYSHDVSKFSFSTTRHIEVHTHYEVRKRTGNKFMRLYKADGNELEFYRTNNNRGLLTVDAKDSVQNIEIKLEDSYGNLRTLNFVLEASRPDANLSSISNTSRQPELYENILKFDVPFTEGIAKNALVYANRQRYEISPSYQTKSTAVYLWDMRVALPDSADACGQKIIFNFDAAVPSQREFNLYLPDLDLSFPKAALFDTLYLETNYITQGGKEVFAISEDIYPMNTSIGITLKPKQTYADKAKTHVYQVHGRNSYGWEGGEWQGNKISFRTRDLGEYTILTDDAPPAIRPVRVNSKSLAFRISDALSGINSYEVKVNGEWLLMHYDYKRALIWSELLYENEALKGPVEVKVTDNAGNVATYSTKL